MPPFGPSPAPTAPEPPSRLAARRRRRWAGALATLLALTVSSADAKQAAAERAPPCTFRVERPFDGQTAVAPSLQPEITRTPGCALFVTLKTADGVDVPFDLEDEGGFDGRATVVPRQDLPNHTDLVLDLGNNPRPCGYDPGVVRFRTGGAPRVLHFAFKVKGDRVDAVSLQLSEPVASNADFEADHIVIAPKETEASLQVTDVVDNQRRNLVRSFRDGSGQPPSAAVPWVVRVKTTLPFATGAALSETFEVEVVPAKNTTFRWRGPDKLCDDGVTQGGCSAGPGLPGRRGAGPAQGAGGLALAATLALWLRRRAAAEPRRS